MRESFAPAAREKELKLRIVPCKQHVRSDPLLLERILLNLVSNALRYTPRGKILVGCRRRGARVRIEVRDSGIGIPQQELRNIFQEFYQLSGADRDRAKGLGLGLAIVERLARLLGHELHVASTPGKGSLFAVEVPRAQAPTERQPTGAATRAAASWVLVVDDDPLPREAMARLLASWNWEVLSAGSRGEALAQIADRDEPPAAIVCDFHLSETDKGTELIERVREHFSLPVPAILVSGDSSAQTFKQARSYGCPLLLKPLRPAKLRALLAHLLSERVAHG
jgi:CheY-like chemotaxis protein/anti-sigma regulatory factor (Ser/Thr protein kinase)